MTIKFENVFLNETATITGPYEKNGPLQRYYDKSYNDLYFNMKTWEQAESKSIEESIDILLNKLGITRFDVNLHISGDLLNQITASNYAASKLEIPYLGVYNACATSIESIIIASSLVEKSIVNNCICSTSSHNNAAEKQFRYPVEYGGPKRKTTTFTTTGAASCFISKKSTGVRIESGTIGRVTDLGIKDVYNMGAVMAPAAAKTIYEHLKDTKRTIDYYDLILTGDLGIYGKKILKEYMETEYNIELKNYNDTGTMIYDVEKQPVYAGASGPACIALVSYGYIFEKLKQKKLKRVLLVATGALMSPVTVNEKLTIPAIAHAISLEVIE